MVDLDICIFAGRLVRNPEKRVTTKGKTVVSFTLAVRTSQRDDNGYKSAFHNCVAYGFTADIVSHYCTKGSELGVIGELRDNKYVDKNGNTKTLKEVYVTSVILGSKANTEDEGISYTPSAQTEAEPKETLADAKDLFGDELEEYIPPSRDELPF